MTRMSGSRDSRREPDDLRRRLSDLSAVTRILAAAKSIDEAAPMIVQALRAMLDAEVCDLWVLAPPGDRLRLAAIDSPGSSELEEFLAESWRTSFLPAEGLPGRVWESGEPYWIEEAADDANFPRAKAAALAGLHTAAAFPVMAGGELFGIVGFFTSRRIQCEDTLRSTMAVVGQQIGQFICHKRTESELRRSQMELLDFVENAAIGLHWVGPDGTILWANRAELEMLGYSHDEYIGHHIGEFHADAEVIDDILRRLGRDEELRGYEARLRCKDGSIIHVSIDSNVSWDADRFAHTRCFTRDITAEKRAEEARRVSETQFSSFMSHLPGAAWIKDLEGRYVYANEYAQRIFRTPLESLRGKADDEIFPPETARQFRENDRQACSSDRGIQTVEELEQEDGVHHSIVSKFPIRTASGELHYVGGVAFDITYQKKAEAELRKFKFIADHSVEAHAILDREGKYLYVNWAHCRMHGYAPEELLGMRVTDVDPAVDLARFQETFDASQRSSLPPFETTHRRRDGTAFPVEVAQTGVVLDGVPYAFAATRDISERKKAQDRVRAEADFRRAIEDAVPDGIAAYDREGRQVYVNRAFCEMFGFHQSELIGCAPPFPYWPPEEVENMAETMQKTLRGQGPSDGYELRFMRKDGQRRDVLVRVKPVDSGLLTGWLASVTDITARKQAERALRESEERLRFTLQAARVGSWDWDIASGRVTWSGNLEQLHARAPGTFGGSVADVVQEVYAPDQVKLQQAIAAALEGDGLFEVEYRIQRPDGSLGWLHGQGRATFDASGRPVRMAGICLDVTERREADQQIRAAREAAEAANRFKSEFLANMSHEIRTPMTAILGYTDVLGHNLSDPDDLQCVDTIRRNGNFLLEIINDILDLSKIEAGKLAIERQQFRPFELMTDILSLMEVRAREKQLALSIECDGPLPQTIISDPTRLRQILVNLVGNAIKFTERGSVRLVVRLDEQAQQLGFDVIDTGIGISEQQQRQLFAPFHQADTSVTRRYGGSGLGLVICKRLVEMLDGDICVESRVGEGSRFSVNVATGSLEGVPLIQPRGELHAPQADADARVDGQLDCHVLVVDDRREVRYVAQQFVEEAGGRVLVAENGREALEVVRRAQESELPIDLVLMDMQMPLMDGYQATSRLREAGFQQPIIALTAHAMQGDREKCLLAGCDDYLSKPIDRRKLVEMIRRYTRELPPSRPVKTISSSAAATFAGRLARPEVSLPASPATRRVLLVDDSRDVCRLMSMLLSARGHEVRFACDGRTAIQEAERFAADVVLLDLALPDMSGFEVAAQLRQLPGVREAIYIALSGNVEAGFAPQPGEAGFHHFVAKPADLDELEKLFHR